MKLLLTWWTWFIWSHTCVELLQAWHEVVIFDNLANSDLDVLDKIAQITDKKPKFVQGDIRDLTALQNVFSTWDIDWVIHFAGLKAVWVSCEDPFGYYDNNILGTINLLRVMDQHNVRNMIFSSSATVYDASQEVAPFGEDMRCWQTTNPYGTTKYIIEQLLQDMCHRKDMKITSLRYFNPVGAHPSWLIGEDPSDIPTNLLPIMMDVVQWKREQLEIYGNDYDTIDGTCIRDFIHVVDLAQAHMVARDGLGKQTWYEYYNVWTWSGSSVSQMVTLCQDITWKPFPHTFVWRRDGDVAVSIADVSKIKDTLWREAKLSSEDALTDALRFRGVVN